MRGLLGFALALAAAPVGAATLDVKVHNAFGASYSTTEIGHQLGALYNISFDPTLVLILGPALDHEDVRRQQDIVADIDPDEHGILFAIGTPRQSYSRGYSVTPNTAAELLPSPDAFRVLVLGASGEVLLDADEVIPRERLIAASPSE